MLDAPYVCASSPVFQAPLLRVRGDEEVVSLASPIPTVMGLEPIVSPPQQGSLTRLLSLLPAEGEVRRRGVRDPAFWAGKAEKAEVRGVMGPLATVLSPTMQNPADFPRVERDSLSCPRKVSRGWACLQQCPSP